MDSEFSLTFSFNKDILQKFTELNLNNLDTKDVVFKGNFSPAKFLGKFKGFESSKITITECSVPELLTCKVLVEKFKNDCLIMLL